MPIILDGTAGIDNNATDLSYTGTLTGGTGVVNLGSGQLVKLANGNVGIGTSSPSQKLDVNGNIVTDSYSLGAGNGIFFRKGFETTAQPSITVEDHSGSAPDGLSVNGADGVSFKTGGSERMRIDSSGNFLVGVTAQFNSCKQGLVFDGSVNIGFAIRNSNVTTGQVLTGFYNSAGTNIRTITQNATTTVAYNTSSDYRLKENIAPMTGALSKVALLKPVTYSWKQEFGGEEGQGFIAHELQEVVPECVTGKKDAVNEDGSIKPQGIDTSFLVATLTAAIQEQQAIIESLTARVVALENQIV